MKRATVTGARHGSEGGTGMISTEDAAPSVARSAGRPWRLTVSGRDRAGPRACDREASRRSHMPAVIERRTAAGVLETGRTAIPPAMADPDPPPDA